MMIHRSLTITGRVQGVFYRDWMVEQATTLGIGGWVRNRADGSVEAMLAGPRESVEALIARAANGPPAARVADVVVVEAPVEAFDGFEKRATR